MRINFYPTDINYVIEDGKAVIELYGRTKEGEQICVLDKTFAPYFTVIGEFDVSEAENTKEGEFFVTNIEKVHKKLNEKETDAYHVYLNIPKGVPVLRELFKKIEGVEGVYEADILFTRRYVLDKKIIPLTLTEASGDEIMTARKCKCINAVKVSPKSSDVLAPKILAFDIETYNPDNKLNMKKNPILMAGLYGKGLSKIITWKKFPTKKDFIEFVPTEADVLLRIQELIEEYQPDMIVGYFSDGFDFPYVIERAKANKVNLELGLDRSKIQMLGKVKPEAKITGVPHIDIYQFIKRVLGRSMKTDSYSLDAVAKELIGKEKKKIDMGAFFRAWDDGDKSLEQYCEYNLQDCLITFELAETVLPNIIEFSRIVNLFPSDIARMSFSVFVEWYLIFKAHSLNEILLNKPGHTEEASRISDRIKGAFVYEPKPGFYENIAVFDYRSLYPSIIASHNISRGTLHCDCCKEPFVETSRGKIWFCTKKKGFFSTTISELISLRAEIKKEIKKNPTPLLKARSEALKLLANSFYGYMGFAPARWYCIECAEGTTAWARNYIQGAIETAKIAGFTVLYSDTDSLFLLLEKKTKDDALALVKQINEKLPSPMELELENFYPAGIFVSVKAGGGGAKKKYCLVDEKGVLKIRGFETVRRNTSFIAKEVQQKVLEIILIERDFKKAKEFVRGIVIELRANKIPLERVVIQTMLSKGTEAYASIGPHVAIAQKMEQKGISLGKGTIIKYVVVKGKGRIRDKVKLPEEALQEEYDGEYYIQNQVIPGVEKIFEVLGIEVEDLVSTTKQKRLDGF